MAFGASELVSLARRAAHLQGVKAFEGDLLPHEQLARTRGPPSAAVRKEQAEVATQAANSPVMAVLAQALTTMQQGMLEGIVAARNARVARPAQVVAMASTGVAGDEVDVDMHGGAGTVLGVLAARDEAMRKRAAMEEEAEAEELSVLLEVRHRTKGGAIVRSAVEESPLNHAPCGLCAGLCQVSSINEAPCK